MFELIVLDEAREFLKSLSPTVRKKIAYNIRKVRGGIKDPELFKKLENSDIWEFRTLYMGKAYRLFAFWDTETQTLIVATHGIIKKTQKTPTKEINKAKAIRTKYFKDKQSSNKK